MSIPVLILGEPGSGKSSSIRGFEPDEAVVIQTISKPLPFKSEIKRASTRDIDKALAWMLGDRNHDVLIVDDFGYLITDIYMRYSYGAEKLRDQYEIYKIIGAKVYNLVNEIMEDGRGNRIVYLMMHVEKDASGRIEPATVGKMLNEKVKLLGMFTIALLSTSQGGTYRFVTNGEPLKSPPGMLPLEMDNDLKAVDTAIREYYGMEPIKAGDAR